MFTFPGVVWKGVTGVAGVDGVMLGAGNCGRLKGDAASLVFSQQQCVG